MNLKKVYLQKGKEKPVLHHHNWVFSGAIAKTESGIKDGEIVALHAFGGEFLAYGFYNSKSKIRLRLLEWKKDSEINQVWWNDKIKQAYLLRNSLIAHEHTNAFRLVFSEGDGLPGLIVDQFGKYLSVQILTAGMEYYKQQIIDALIAIVSPSGIYERSDVPARQLEGLPEFAGLLYGEVPDEITIQESSIHYTIQLATGQKSGFYVDQRENRMKVSKFAANKRVLDCFSYTGGFSLHALQQNAAELVAVDSSESALQNLHLNAKLNGFDLAKLKTIQADAFQYLRELVPESFDMVIIDPPKLAPSRQSVPKAERAYKDLNMQAIRACKKGGYLVSFSCSGSITLEHLKQIMAWAATDVGRELQFIEDLSQPFDHPVRAAFPESAYLKGVIARLLG